jgi:aryl-alcohol dehydrogenase-like predicted oxidoreductase
MAAGVNLIDTANWYSAGLSEEIVGLQTASDRLGPADRALLEPYLGG